MAMCGVCGRRNREGARFCDTCGTALVLAVAGGEVRKTVTIVFCDVIESTALGGKLDPEPLRRVMSRFFAEMKAVLESHGGIVEKFIGDAVMAVFGIPKVHEDDALRAVRAASEMRETLAMLNKELERDHGVTIQARIGVNTGQVVAGDASTGQALVTGDAVNVAARLEHAAAPREVLIGGATYRLVRDAVVAEPVAPLELKGKPEPVATYRLVELLSGAPGHAPRLRSPMVGRDLELRHLLDTFETSVADTGCHLVTVIGDAGVGKSRLVEEFCSAVGDRAMVLRGRCLPYGEGITYFAAAEVIKQAVGLHDFDAAEEARRKLGAMVEGKEHAELLCSRVSQLLGLPGAQAMAQETFWAIRSLLEAVARRRPLAVLFEDLHWAEPAFLDLVEYITAWCREASILLVCTARPDLLDERPGWTIGEQNATTLSLSPLGERDAERLVNSLLRSADLGTDLPARIAETAEGNPLFVEEMLSMLIDDGLLVRSDHTWVAAPSLSSVPVPPTIQAVLAARLARLSPSERTTVERASVVGKEFYLGAVAALAPIGTRETTARDVAALVRKDLVEPGRSRLPGEEACRFRHMLIRDAAYEGIPKGLRAELHEGFAFWLEQVAGERITEQEEIAGYHLEQAFLYRRDLGPIDEHGRELANRASVRLVAAGRRAFDRGDINAADLLGRAASLLPEDDPARIELLRDLADTRRWMGDLEESKAILEQAIQRARAAGDRRLERHALVRLSELANAIQPSVHTTERMQLDAEQAIGVFEEIGDEAGLASAWLLLLQAFFIRGRYADAGDAGKRAVEHARRAGRPREEAMGLFQAAVALTWGPTPVTEVIRWLQVILRSVGDSFDRAALEGTQLSLLLAMLGRFDEARANFEVWRAILEDAGLESAIAYQHWGLGRIEMLAGNEQAAEADIRAAYAALEANGSAGNLSTCAADLAEVVYRRGGLDEAEQLTEISERSGAADDMATQVGWRAVRAKVLARRGDLRAGERLAREAAAVAETTDGINMQANALMDLAEVLGLADRRPEAAAAVREALALYARKGDLVSAERARALLSELTSS
jgi:class 3 adenylate cyclase/tetratricopeptide (TPR) repeat protein